MVYRALADAVVVVHFGFVLFVVAGGLLALRWRRAPWVHLPAAAWGAGVEFAGALCPLTPLENWLRVRGGRTGFQGSFVEQYLLPVLYPSGLTREVQLGLGAAVVAVNVAVYAWVFGAARRRRRGR